MFALTYKDWERHLPHLLFAYREVPQEATGFSPFELLNSRRVWGALDLLREHWEGTLVEEGTSIMAYVLELQHRLQRLFATRQRQSASSSKETEKVV